MKTRHRSRRRRRSDQLQEYSEVSVRADAKKEDYLGTGSHLETVYEPLTEAGQRTSSIIWSSSEFQRTTKIDSNCSTSPTSSMTETPNGHVRKETFIPAAEFFNDLDQRDRLTSDYYSGNDTPSKLRESTKYLSLKKPHNSYIAYSSDEELEEWWNAPKTDYTYSASLSYRGRVTPDRQIGSPNMSRKGLHGSGIHLVSSPPFTSSDMNLNTAHGSRNLTLRSRKIPRSGLDAFSDCSDAEETQVIRTSRSRLDKNYESSRMAVSKTTLSHTIEYGLDESDTDEAVNSSLHHISKPVIRKGRTPLVRGSTPILSNSSSYATSNSVSHVTNSRHSRYTDTSATVNSISERRGFPHSDTDQDIVFYLWKDKFSEWRFKTITAVKWMANTIWASIILCLIKLSSIGIKARNYLFNKDQRTSKFYLNQFSAKVKRSNIADESSSASATSSSSASSSSSISSILMSKQHTVVTVTKHYYKLYQEKRKRSPFCWGWLPLLFLLLLCFLPLCAFWLWQSSETVENYQTSHTESWQSVFFLNIFHSIKDSINWLLIFALNFISVLWNKILYISSYFNSLILVILDILKVIGLWLFNFFRSLYVWTMNLLLPHFNEYKGVEGIKPTEESVWLYLPMVWLSHGYIYVTSSIYSIAASSQNLVSYCGLYLAGWFAPLGHFLYWLVQAISYFIYLVASALWTFLLFIFTFLWSSAVSCTATVASGTSALMGGVSEYLMLLPWFRTSTTYDLKEGQSDQLAMGDRVSVSHFLQSTQFKQFIAVALDEHLSAKGLPKEGIQLVVRAAMEDELQDLRSAMLLSETKAGDQLAASQEQMMLLKEQQHQLLHQLRDLESTINVMSSSLEENGEQTEEGKKTLEDFLFQTTGSVQKLTEQVNTLQSGHDSLKLEVRSCCQLPSLTLQDVENHVSLLLSDALGCGERADGAESVEDTFAKSRFGMWLTSYFVAKEQLERRLGDLMKNIHSHIEMKYSNYVVSHEETVQQTNREVMDAVIEKLRNEIQEHQVFIAQQMKEFSEMADVAQQNIRNTADEGSKAIELSTQNAQQETDYSIKLALKEAFVSRIPATIAAETTQKLDMAVRQHLPFALKEQLNDSSDRKFAGEMKKLIMDQVTEIIQDHFSNRDKGFQTEESFMRLKVDSSSHTSEVRDSSGSDIEGFFGGTVMSVGFNESHINRLIGEALRKYDADKTGMVDHALESAGGTIVSTRCTEGYQGHQAELTILGYPIYRYSTNTPRSIIQPERMPGQCYAFKGSQGFIVIQFAAPVKVTQFSMEHIPKALSPTGTIDSAPKEFAVYGLQTPNEEGYHLGTFEYVDNNEPLQFFPVANYTEEYFQYVELKIISNHGNIIYTCVYRFRVHGIRKF